MRYIFQQRERHEINRRAVPASSARQVSMAVSFNLPIDLSRLQNDRLKLVPLEENLEEWAETYVQDANRNPHVYD